VHHAVLSRQRGRRHVDGQQYHGRRFGDRLYRVVHAGQRHGVARVHQQKVLRVHNETLELVAPVDTEGLDARARPGMHGNSHEDCAESLQLGA
jgi:hypothetical protein